MLRKLCAAKVEFQDQVDTDIRRTLSQGGWDDGEHLIEKNGTREQRGCCLILND